jgi:hypothetical protein
VKAKIRMGGARQKKVVVWTLQQIGKGYIGCAWQVAKVIGEGMWTLVKTKNREGSMVKTKKHGGVLPMFPSNIQNYLTHS